MKLLITLLLFIIGTTLTAQKKYDFNANCQNAYNNILALKLNAAQQLLNSEKQVNTNNLIPYFLENYIDFFVLFFNEDPTEYSNRQPNWEKHLLLMEEAPDSDPFKKFSKSIIKLQSAIIEIKFGNQWNASFAFKAAFKYAKENSKAYPNFIPNKMIMGPLQMVAGTIPSSYKWIASIGGIKGSIKEGTILMNSFLSSNDAWARIMRNEGIFYNTYLKFYLLNQTDEALQYMRQQKLDVINNHLFAFMAANLSLNNKQSFNCKQYVSQRNASAEYLKTNVWDFEMAYAKLYHLESDAAVYFERYLTNFKGKFYVKDCWLKLSWHYYLQGDTKNYQRCLQNAISKGNKETEADKRAEKEAKANKPQNIILLKARLLNDGGYHQEAYNILAGKSTSSFTTDEEKLEFTYRLGRIYDDLDRFEDAIKAYQASINLGKNRKEYYAARAALQSGYIYEKRNQKPQAIAFFEACINMEDHDYENSLEQRAKAGIARCKGE